MSQITSHVLDIAKGVPANAVPLALYHKDLSGWTLVAEGCTNQDGRALDLCSQGEALEAGVYRLNFATEKYFQSVGDTIFYPWVDVVFNILGDGQHYHIPLSLSPFGYSTYRGS